MDTVARCGYPNALSMKIFDADAPANSFTLPSAVYMLAQEGNKSKNERKRTKREVRPPGGR
jgi:hypothetical protein